jgi:gamma-glutamyl hercynylcysteine S-oxide synthase
MHRAALVETYRRNRQRTRQLFDLLMGDATYYSQPIALRHPIVFYEGHLPAFSFNTLVKRGLGGPSIDPELERLFARGIDPDENDARGDDPAAHQARWPSRATVQAFADEADARVLDALAHADIEQPGHPLLDRAEAAFAILEHEAMHQETLLYMWHRLALEQKRRPEGYRPRVDGAVPAQQWIRIPEGHATLGVDPGTLAFSWDNERPAYMEPVRSFEIEQHNVTNAAFMDFVDAGGYLDPQWWTPEDWEWVQKEQIAHPLCWERHDGEWFWRGMFDLIALPPSWPVYVSHAEAAAFARWREARLPTEAEHHRAAAGAAAVEAATDFASWDPIPAGTSSESASAYSVHDVIGNGWEWTSTVFAPFPGFTALPSYPEYSADFFDGDHFVMKGASTVTARDLIRPTFRNWFRPHYPYVYATFRCARDIK